MNAFKIDENLPKDAAALLRARGHDALTVGEQGRAGTQDPHLLRICHEEKIDRQLWIVETERVRVWQAQE